MDELVITTIAVMSIGVAAAISGLMWQIVMDRRDPDGDDAGLSIFDPPELHPALFVERSPMVDAVERAEWYGRIAEFQIRRALEEADAGPGRHRAYNPDDRDPRMQALLTTTAEYDAAFAEMVGQLELPLEATP